MSIPIQMNTNNFIISHLFVHSFSGKSGGGGGSGGSISFSACTLTAGSSAKIEAKGGTGGQGRTSYGKRLFVMFV